MDLILPRKLFLKRTRNNLFPRTFARPLKLQNEIAILFIVPHACVSHWTRSAPHPRGESQRALCRLRCIPHWRAAER